MDLQNIADRWKDFIKGRNKNSTTTTDICVFVAKEILAERKRCIEIVSNLGRGFSGSLKAYERLQFYKSETIKDIQNVEIA